MALTDQYTVGANPAFVQRVTMAVLSTAAAVSSEATSVANHTNRVVLARAAFLNPSQYGSLFAFGVASNLTLTPGTVATTTDQTILNSVSALWNGYSGVP
jgi:hypothetical protein